MADFCGEPLLAWEVHQNSGVGRETRLHYARSVGGGCGWLLLEVLEDRLEHQTGVFDAVSIVSPV